ncbi:MAG: TrkH family potassium uptake protein [Alphaproteobacteria bacterium]|nr:TrkH family potassium uptake protein [Alphaproteobacteria bacterium]OJV13138.1 MAG: hypothetical protein BGO27_02820 [Alphaproteobacteria bacterium 33-17]
MTRRESTIKALNFVLIFFGLLMLIPGVWDYCHNNNHYYYFVIIGVVGIAIGFLLNIFSILTTKGAAYFAPRYGFLTVIMIWIFACIYTALPLYFSIKGLGVTNAVFEAVSGLTSCGASVVVNLQHKSPGILLWRSLLNYVGGLGIVVIGVAILPNLKIGGMQMFNMEFTEKSDKILPKVESISIIIITIYMIMTTIGIFTLYSFGMSFFDAICHTLTAISTGGFANYDNSVAYFKNFKIDIILMVLMLFGATSFIHFYHLQHQQFDKIRQDVQFKYYLGTILVIGTAVFLYNYLTKTYELVNAIHYSFFNTISVLTTTGFANTNYDNWHMFPKFCLIIAAIIGGMTGSTTGGIKVFRIVILFKVIRNYINTLIHPHGVFKIHYNGKYLNDQVAMGAVIMVVSYFIVMMVGMLIMSLSNLDGITIISSVISALSNAGFGLGEHINPDGSFNNLPTFAKWNLIVLMIIGRLEIITFMVLINKNFWKK